MNPMKVLANQTAAILRLFGDEITREEAAELLPKTPAMKVLRTRDAAGAGELAALVLAQFRRGAVPTDEGLDWLPAVEADAAVLVAEVAGGWDDDTSRCARCGTAYSPSWATHCVPCDGPMRVVSDPTPHGFTPHGHPCCSSAVGDGPDLVARCNATLGCPSCQDAAEQIHAGGQR